MNVPIGRRRAAPAVVLALGGVTALAVSNAGAVGLAAGRTTTPVTEHVQLKLKKKSDGATKFEHTGRATGTVPGTVRSKITLRHSLILRGTVTVKTSKGEMRLKVDGRATSLELRTKFSGKATMLAGTGRYKDGRGSGTFKGTVNRSTWAVTLDATGSFSY